jgi:hypothetical protein
MDRVCIFGGVDRVGDRLMKPHLSMSTEYDPYCARVIAFRSLMCTHFIYEVQLYLD